MPALAEVVVGMLALLGAFFHAVSVIFTRKGLIESNVLSGFLMNMISSTAFFWALLPLYFQDIISQPLVIVLFAAGGISGTVLGRLFLFKGMAEVGASASTALHALAPIMASSVGFALLREVPTIEKIIGILLATLGVAMLSSTGKSSGWRKRSLVFPILAAAFFGFGLFFRKSGLILHNYPLFAGTVSTTAALLTFLPFLLAAGGNKQIVLRKKSFINFILGGVTESAGTLFVFVALSLGALSTVAPVSTTYPLFTLVLASIFLKVVEKITLRTILSVVMTVTGVILVTSF